MKKIIILMIITTIIYTNLVLISSADSTYLSQYVKENEKEFNDITDYLKNYGETSLPSNPEEIKTNDIIRVYAFKQNHLPNYFKEFGKLSENIIDTYEYKYFSPEGYTLIIGKNEKNNNEWKVFKTSSELRTAANNHKDVSFKFSDMIIDIEESYPDYDYDSVKYIEYYELGTFLVYFMSNGIEYLACYPINTADNGELVPCGEILTAEEYINIIKNYPIFNHTEPAIGIGGGIKDTIKNDTNINNIKNSTTNSYIYIGTGIFVAVICLLYYTTKRRKNKI